MKEATAKSGYIKTLTAAKHVVDTRKLAEVPQSTNHFYGWVPQTDKFKLEKYGPDCFTPLPLPKYSKL